MKHNLEKSLKQEDGEREIRMDANRNSEGAGHNSGEETLNPPIRVKPEILMGGKLRGAKPQIDAIAQAVIMAAAAKSAGKAEVATRSARGGQGKAEEPFEPTARFDTETLRRQHQELRESIGGVSERDASKSSGGLRRAVIYGAVLVVTAIGSFAACYVWMSTASPGRIKIGDDVRPGSEVSALPPAVLSSGGKGVSPTNLPTSPSGDASSTAQTFLRVHIAGAVKRPGIHYLLPGDRIADAVTVAGGARVDADLQAIHLELPVTDGQQIWVPTHSRQPRTDSARRAEPTEAVLYRRNRRLRWHGGRLRLPNTLPQVVSYKRRVHFTQPRYGRTTFHHPLQYMSYHRSQRFPGFGKEGLHSVASSARKTRAHRTLQAPGEIYPRHDAAFDRAVPRLSQP